MFLEFSRPVPLSGRPVSTSIPEYQPHFDTPGFDMLWLKTNQKAALPTHRLFKECRKAQCTEGMGTDIQRLSKTKKSTFIDSLIYRA